jgi:acetyl esterase
VVLLAVAMAVARPGGPAPAGAAPTVRADVAYGTSAAGPLLADVYLPDDGRPSHPAVLLIHGGGWLVGDKSAMQPEGMALAQAGFVAFSINYDMTTEPHWPTELENVQAALRWVQDNAATYGVDVARIGALGGSAGGNLAELLGTDGPGADGYQPLRAVASWSGPSDLRTLAVSILPSSQLTAPGTLPPNATPSGCADDPNCFAILQPDLLLQYLGCSYNLCPWTYAAASPAGKVTTSTPPMYLAGSEEDFVPMEQNWGMANALNENGVRSVLQYVGGNRHADAYRDVALAPTVEFLRQELGPAAAPHVAPRSTPTTVAGSVALPPLEDGWRLPAATVPVPVLLVATVLAVVLSVAVVAAGVVVAVRRRRRRHRDRAAAAVEPAAAA